MQSVELGKMQHREYDGQRCTFYEVEVHLVSYKCILITIIVAYLYKLDPRSDACNCETTLTDPRQRLLS